MANAFDEKKLTGEFADCLDVLQALGDPTRQHMIVKMMSMGDCNGVRVGEITKKTNLSRPAVSHHLQILKRAGILKIRKEGTRNYYYFDRQQESLKSLIKVLQFAVDTANALPERSE